MFQNEPVLSDHMDRVESPSDGFRGLQKNLIEIARNLEINCFRYLLKLFID